MNGRAPAILDHLASLADTTRSRILLLLDRHELTVSELCGVMQLPQSTVSRHLKALSDSGWIASRAEGTSRLYTTTRPSTASGRLLAGGRDALDPSARRLWLLVQEHVGATSVAAADQRRLQSALSARRTKSQEFFSSAAGHWDRLRDELFGNAFHLAALAALADRHWVVGDLGCGTGQVSVALAPFVARVVAVDSSAAMLQAARKRLQGFDNVDLRRGDLEALPIDDEWLDAATLMLVLHHVPEPGKALAEVARVLKPGGRVLVVDMLPHDRESYRQQMGHVWLGFGADQTRRMLDASGFEDIRIVPLAADVKARGPVRGQGLGAAATIPVDAGQKRQGPRVLDGRGVPAKKVEGLAQRSLGLVDLALPPEDLAGVGEGVAAQAGRRRALHAPARAAVRVQRRIELRLADVRVADAQQETHRKRGIGFGERQVARQRLAVEMGGHRAGPAGERLGDGAQALELLLHVEPGIGGERLQPGLVRDDGVLPHVGLFQEPTEPVEEHGEQARASESLGDPERLRMVSQRVVETARAGVGGAVLEGDDVGLGRGQGGRHGCEEHQESDQRRGRQQAATGHDGLLRRATAGPPRRRP